MVRLNNFSYFLLIFAFIYGINLLIQNTFKTIDEELNYYNEIKQFDKISLGSKESSYVSVISVYFSLKHSKHSTIQYEKWLIRLLESVSSPLILFTDDKSLEIIRKFRKYPITIYKFNYIWELLQDLERERNRTYMNQYILEQHDKDPEKHIHNPGLYAVWNLKPHIASIAVKDNPYNSVSFIYTDTGAWRSPFEFEDWPNISFVKKLMNTIEEKILLGQIYNDRLSSYFPLQDLIQGGFFMGSKNAINFFKKEYYRIHDERFDKGLFIGKEQTMMNLIAFDEKNYNSVLRIKARINNCTLTYNPWLFYQIFLAHEKYYICYDPKLSLLLQNNA